MGKGLRKITRLFLKASIGAGLFLLGFSTVYAASLFISPTSQTVEEGDTFSASVYVDTDGEVMNAISGMLSYPQDKLDVVNLSTASSIVSLWINSTPTDSAGEILFEGIVPNPGFQGVSGKIFTGLFRAKTAGVAILSFSQSEVYANDGLGTELALTTTAGSINIQAPVIDEGGDEDGDTGDEGGDGDTGGDQDGDGPSGGGLAYPSAPRITSSSHPDPDRWYSNRDVEISWETNETITGIRVGATPESDGAPTDELDVLESSTILNLDNGVWYVHVQARNAKGWGDIGSVKVKVDALEPSAVHVTRVATQEGVGAYSTDFKIESQDIPSGIDYFEIRVNKLEPVRWEGNGQVFSVKNLPPGEHSIVVRGYDEAGNSAVSYVTFTLSAFDPIGVGEIVGTPEPIRVEVPLPTVLTPEIVSVASYAGFGVGIGQAIVFAGNAKSLLDIWMLLLRFFSFIGSFFRRRKGEPWGVVYDSVTKQPLDPAYVVIKQGDEQKGMAITDLDGRYGFLVEEGEYTIEANKTHYAFPSKKLAGRKRDELYDNLYFGGPVSVGSEGKGLINYNIPLDPTGFDWNEYAKKQQGLFYTHSNKKRYIIMISNIVFFLGFGLSLYMMWFAPTLINTLIFMMYVGILVFQALWRASHPITKVMMELSQEVVPFAVVKAYLSGNNQLVKTVVADEEGHFYLLTPPGTYYFTVEEKKPDGSYSQKYRTGAVRLRKGVVLKNLVVHRDDTEIDSQDV
jgi:hypothetical protein